MSKQTMGCRNDLEETFPKTPLSAQSLFLLQSYRATIIGPGDVVSSVNLTVVRGSWHWPKNKRVRAAASRCVYACPTPPSRCTSPWGQRGRAKRRPTRPTCWPTRGSGCKAVCVLRSKTIQGTARIVTHRETVNTKKGSCRQVQYRGKAIRRRITH